MAPAALKKVTSARSTKIEDAPLLRASLTAVESLGAVQWSISPVTRTSAIPSVLHMTRADA